MNQGFAKKNHKKEKLILIGIIIFSVIMILLFSYLLVVSIKNQPLVKYPKYTLSTTEWTSSNVIITVDAEGGNISYYSFDGGKNYQDSNVYEVPSNGEFYIVVKDINGRTSKMTPVSIQNIDKDAPIITFEGTTTVQLGSRFSLRNGVTVTDGSGSGINSNYVVVPDNIDTSVAGEYIVTYTVFDKVGNYTEKQRKIIVMDIKGKTYYRYRTATYENYQCDAYMCNCVKSESAKLTLTCPSGYTFNEPDKCCQTCYKTCKRTVWSEWSEWTQEKVSATSTREVETKIE